MTERDRILQLTNGGLDVFVHYMGESCKKKTFRNPYRGDSSPSCHLYYNEDKNGGVGRYFLKDYGASEWTGDCFWFVSQITGIDIRNSFMDILRLIDRECELFILDDGPAVVRPVMKKVDAVCRQDSHPVQFTPKYRNFNKYELEYWMSYGITLDILTHYHVRCLSSCYFERDDSYTIYGTKDIPMFGYTFNEGAGIKVYRPGAEIGRFLYAGNLPRPYVFGLEQLPVDMTDYIFVTGGEKDAMTLAAHGFHAVCLNSETSKVPDALLCQLSSRCHHLVFLYDCDETGKREASLRVRECREFILQHGERFSNPSFDVFAVTLPLAGTKKEKDISDFFRSGRSAADLQALLASAEEYALLNDTKTNMI